MPDKISIQPIEKFQQSTEQKDDEEIEQIKHKKKSSDHHHHHHNKKHKQKKSSSHRKSNLISSSDHIQSISSDSNSNPSEKELINLSQYYHHHTNTKVRTDSIISMEMVNIFDNDQLSESLTEDNNNVRTPKKISKENRHKSIVLKHIKLSQKLVDGIQSSKKSIIVDAKFNDEKVKVKLSKNEAALLHEFNTIQKLNRKANDYFIHPYEFFCGNKFEIICCDESNDDLFPYFAFIMENGNIDLCKYTFLHFHDKSFLLEFKIIGYDICEILKILHSNNYIWMDFKPANVVRIVTDRDGRIHHKAIDFDSCIKINNNYSPTTTSTTSTTTYNNICYNIGGTARYISPEVAIAVILKSEKKQCDFKPTTAIDVFSFALWVFEVYNKQKSLWECMDIDISNDTEVFQCASKLTDNKIKEIIDIHLGSENSTAARHWLLDALKVNPNERLSIEQLNDRHTLFTTKYATIDIDNIAMKFDYEHVIIKAIHRNNQLIKNDIHNEFHNFEQLFSNTIKQIVVVDKKEGIIEGINDLKHELELQKAQQRIDIISIQNLVKNLSCSDISMNIVSSALSEMLPISSMDTNNNNKDKEGKLSMDVIDKLDTIIHMITQVQDKVDNLTKNVTNIKKLTSILVKKHTVCPHTFVILPKKNKSTTTTAKTPSGVVPKVWETITTNIINPISTSLWDESVLIFICPITLKQVKCGPNDEGYDIKIPTARLKSFASIMRWGLFFMKIALATQGLASLVPVDCVSSILDTIDDNYVNDIVAQLYNEDIMNEMIDSLANEQDQVGFEWIIDFLMQKEGYTGVNSSLEWEPKYTGLIKVVSEFDGSCMWISKESKQEFMEKGMQAIIQMKNIP